MKKYLIGLLAALICILPFNQAEAGVMAQAKKTTQTRKSSTQSHTAAKKNTARKPVARKHTAKTTQRSNTKTGRKGTKKSTKPNYSTEEIRGLQSKRSAMQKEIKKQEAALRKQLRQHASLLIWEILPSLMRYMRNTS